MLKAMKNNKDVALKDFVIQLKQIRKMSLFAKLKVVSFYKP
jgi:hypothetical protein